MVPINMSNEKPGEVSLPKFDGHETNRPYDLRYSPYKIPVSTTAIKEPASIGIPGEAMTKDGRCTVVCQCASSSVSYMGYIETN